MGRIQFTIAPDGLRAELRAGPGPAMTQAQFEAALKDAGIVHGVDRDVIAACAARLLKPEDLFVQVVANGKAAVPGQDGRIESALFGALQPGCLHKDGTIDYRERELLHPVREDDTIGTVIAPTPGTPGMDVRGRAIAAKPGRPHTRRFGKGVRLVGDEIHAVIAGVLLATERLVDVVPLFTHKADVGYASGNLHTHGALAVQGDVLPGFTAEADGDIVVTGTVQDATVRAGGSVRVQQGIVGRSAHVRAGGDVHCRHATAARIQATQGVAVMEQCSQARVAADRIRVVDGRGTVLGGDLRARREIDIDTAGSPGGGATLLAVAELLDEEVELARRTLASAKTDRATVRARRESAGTKDMKGLRSSVRALDQKAAEALRLRARQKELLATAVIRVRRVLHPGTVLRFGTIEMRTDTPQPPSEFHFDLEHDRIVQGPIR